MPNTQQLGVIQQQGLGFQTVNNVGQQVVFNATILDIAAHNARVAASLAPFVEDDTEKYEFQYKGRGGGRLQRRGLNSAPAEMQAGSDWKVGFPLEDFAGAVGVNDVTFAHMTVNEWANKVNAVFDADIATVREEMLRALLNKAGRPGWKDQVFTDIPAIDVKPLANGDGTKYAANLGQVGTAERNHYRGVATAATVLTDDNCPISDAVSDLKKIYGPGSGSASVITFVNSAQTPSIKLLSSYYPLGSVYIQPGSDTPRVVNVPTNLPGDPVGYADNSLIIEWDSIPANYTFSMHLGAPRPLLRRVDLGLANLGRNLQLVAKRVEFPIETSYWRNRFGFGAAERTNGIVYDLATGSSNYTTPALYA